MSTRRFKQSFPGGEQQQQQKQTLAGVDQCREGAAVMPPKGRLSLAREAATRQEGVEEGMLNARREAASEAKRVAAVSAARVAALMVRVTELEQNEAEARSSEARSS